MLILRIALATSLLGLALTLSSCSPADSRSGEPDDELPDAVSQLRTLTAASSHEVPAISGLVHYRGALYLAVHDTKWDDAGPRLAVVRVDRQAPPDHRELVVDWQAVGGRSHDLESIVAIPGRAGEYLTTESRHRGSTPGRILHLVVSGDRLTEVEARAIGSFELPADVENVEGMALVARKGRATQLGLCERNERKGDSRRDPADDRYAFIRWAELDFDRYLLRSRFTMRLRAERWPSGKGLRTCSELYFDRGREQLWLAATLDDEGQRHDSMLYRMRFDSAMLDADGEWKLTPWARIPGYKVEAIAAPLQPGWGPTLGSDGDDDAGLIWPVEPERAPRELRGAQYRGNEGVGR